MLQPRSLAGRGSGGDALNYRDFLTVVLILKDRDAFADNWIYIHDPSVMVGRVQNFKSWSPEMVPDPALTCYGLEYFCFEDDGLWNFADEQLERTRARRRSSSSAWRDAEDIVDALRGPAAQGVPGV